MANSADFNGLQTLSALLDNQFIGGIILYALKDVVPFGKKMFAVPFGVLWG